MPERRLDVKLFLVLKHNGEVFGFTDEAEANRNALQMVDGRYLKVAGDVESVEAVNPKPRAGGESPVAELKRLRKEVEGLKAAAPKKGKK
jgi:hypothetical protein